MRSQSWDFIFFCVCGTRDGTQGPSTSGLYPQTYFIFYLETGPCYVAKLLRLALNLLFSCLSFPNTEITGVRHCAQLDFLF